MFKVSQRLSDLGYSIGDWLLAWCYEAGEGCKFDLETAFYYHKKAAEAQIPFSWAFKTLGLCYQDGFGTEVNKSKALFWFQKAEEAIKYRPYLSDALCSIGVIYQYGGEDIKIDLSKACQYYEKAANLGDARGARNLSNRYLKGEGVVQDYQKSFYWMEKAAIFGDSGYQYQTGLCYLYGQTFGGLKIEKNKDRAIHFFKQSAAQGNVKSMKMLAELGL